jgi:hypothetical protein
MHDRAQRAAEILAACGDCPVVRSANVGYVAGINGGPAEAALAARRAASSPTCSGQMLPQ